MLGPCIIWLCILFFIPIAILFGRTFYDPQIGLNTENIHRILTTEAYLAIMSITVKIALSVTLIVIVTAYPIAYYIASSEGRNSLLTLVLLPFWTSYLVRIFAWLALLGRNGLINNLLQYLHITDSPLKLVYTYQGVLIGMVHALIPLAVLTMYANMKNIPQVLRESAFTLGSSRVQTFWRIYFPLSFSGVTAAALMVFIIALGFFTTPALLGSAKETMITLVVVDMLHTSLNWGLAGAIAILMLFTAMGAVYVYQKIFGLTAVTGFREEQKESAINIFIGNFARATGIAFLRFIGSFFDYISKALEMVAKRTSKMVFKLGFTGVFFVLITFLVVPMFVLFPVSISESKFLEWPPRGFTFHWYTSYFGNPIWISAIARSFVVASITGVIATVIGFPAAIILVRERFPLKNMLITMITAPMILPHIILAISLFYAYSKVRLVGTTIGLVLGHTALAIPFVVITVSSVLRNYDQQLDQAAMILGAPPLVVFRRITFPLLASGVFAGFFFAFITSFDELTVALFVTGGLMSTLPKLMWADALDQVSPGLAAISVVIFAVLTIALFVMFQMKKPRKTV